MFFFAEKKDVKNSYLSFWALIFKRDVSILHKKIDYLQKLKFYLRFNKRYFPNIKSKWFLKKLFNYRKQKFFWSKLWKIRSFVRRFSKLWLNIREYFNKWENYYLAWDSYFTQIDLQGFNPFFLKKGF